MKETARRPRQRAGAGAIGTGAGEAARDVSTEAESVRSGAKTIADNRLCYAPGERNGGRLSKRVGGRINGRWAGRSGARRHFIETSPAVHRSGRGASNRVLAGTALLRRTHRATATGVKGKPLPPEGKLPRGTVVSNGRSLCGAGVGGLTALPAIAAGLVRGHATRRPRLGYTRLSMLPDGPGLRRAKGRCPSRLPHRGEPPTPVLYIRPRFRSRRPTHAKSVSSPQPDATASKPQPLLKQLRLRRRRRHRRRPIEIPRPLRTTHPRLAWSEDGPASSPAPYRGHPLERHDRDRQRPTIPLS